MAVSSLIRNDKDRVEKFGVPIVFLGKDFYQNDVNEYEFAISQLARIWVKGVDIDWLKALPSNESYEQKEKKQQIFIDFYSSNFYRAKQYYLLDALLINKVDSEQKECQNNIIILSDVIIANSNPSLEKSIIIKIEGNCIGVSGKIFQIYECLDNIQVLISSLPIKLSKDSPIRMVWVYSINSKSPELNFFIDNYTKLLLLRKFCQQKIPIKHVVILQYSDNNFEQYLGVEASLSAWLDVSVSKIQIICYYQADSLVITLSDIDSFVAMTENIPNEKIIFYNHSKTKWQLVRGALFLPLR